MTELPVEGRGEVPPRRDRGAVTPSAASLSRRLYGTDEPVPAPIALRAGLLDLAWRAGKLLPIRVGDAEIWHGVTFPFRDPDWFTPEPVVTETTCERSDDGFRLTMRGHIPASVAIDLTVEVEGLAEGRVRFAGEATPRADILTNRLGLCVLHPMSAAGCRVEVTHDDGRRSISTLPVLVPAWPPFTLVRAIRHEYLPGHWACCAFAGDVFEFEDQRNNADASFKTYSRSNLMPRPYRLRARAPIRQEAELWLEAPAARPTPRRRARPVTIAVEGDVRSLPRIGIEVGAADLAGHEALGRRLAELRPAFLHLALWDGAAEPDWQVAGGLLSRLGATLRLDLVAADPAGQPAAVDALGAALERAGVTPEAVAVFPCEQDAVDLARRAFTGSRIGGGTPHYLAQLNRLERLGTVDFVSFTSSPLVHGAADDDVMTSLRSLPSLIDTVRARHPGLPVRVGPSGIGVRRSPLGGQPASDGTRRLALARRDPRSRAQYGAAWALGHVAGLAEAGIEAITLMSLTGDAGLVDIVPDGRSDPETVRHPAFFVLQRLSGASRHRRAVMSDPDRVAALALLREGETEILAANLTADPVEVVLQGGAQGLEASVLDAESPDGFVPLSGRESITKSWSAATIRLGPYAVASLTGTGRSRQEDRAP